MLKYHPDKFHGDDDSPEKLINQKLLDYVNTIYTRYDLEIMKKNNSNTQNKKNSKKETLKKHKIIVHRQDKTPVKSSREIKDELRKDKFVQKLKNVIKRTHKRSFKMDTIHQSVLDHH